MLNYQTFVKNVLYNKVVGTITHFYSVLYAPLLGLVMPTPSTSDQYQLDRKSERVFPIGVRKKDDADPSPKDVLPQVQS